MLKFLHIENIAVIERADISFEGHFSVLTGETGAGKSIIIDAINTVLGHRVSKDIIRTGCDQVVVSAVFDALPNDLLTLLSENGYGVEENGDLLISRTLQKNGNGLIRINNRPATVSFLREVGQRLLDVHGQHDNQRLLDAKNHVIYIDKLAENDGIKQQYSDEFHHLTTVRKRIKELDQSNDEKQRRMDLLSYQIEELKKADIQIGETEKLKQQLSIAENYQKMMRLLKDAYFYLNGDDENDGAVELVKKAKTSLQALPDRSYDKTAERLAEVFSIMEDTCLEIRDFTENGEYADMDAETLRNRLDFLRKLMKKYGDTEEEMLEFLAKSEAELSGLRYSEEEVERLSEELNASTERLIALGEKVTASRKKASDRFARQVTAVLAALDMPKVAFQVSIQKGKYSKNGCDEIEFLISANEGESVRPLSKIASGGELSRVMLAVKSVLAEKDEVPTLIFDEIDAGISGHAAQQVGRQIGVVARSHQVLCVTHLPQIAAFADEHFFIEKTSVDHRASTTVRVLGEQERIGEIARLMSGAELTDNLYNSAKELLDRSKKNDNL
ncbi:MAG: DNA repair protein RecN [Clostridia bacterium]|nr:DNA repair protein RecN [Clostridia bacterium]